MIKLNNKLFLNKGIYDNKEIFENTLDSIKKTINEKLGLYLTVRETKDNILVVYEDGNLSRLHNVKDRIDEMTYDELSYLSFYHIPTLKEALKLINGKCDIILNLKIKPNNKEIYSILDDYTGTFLIIGGIR